MSGWVYMKAGMLNDETVGPVGDEDIKRLAFEGALKPKTMVSHPAHTKNQWTSAEQIGLLMQQIEKGRNARSVNKEKSKQEQHAKRAEEKRLKQERKAHRAEEARVATQEAVAIDENSMQPRQGGLSHTSTESVEALLARLVKMQEVQFDWIKSNNEHLNDIQSNTKATAHWVGVLGVFAIINMLGTAFYVFYSMSQAAN